jgi:tetratricopeptide (TPR) repeat protein
MKKLATIIICFLISAISYGQNDQVLDLVGQGVELHRQGSYKEALNKYEEALKIDPESALANYEIAYTYFVMGDHSNSIKHCKLVLEVESDIDYLAYVVMGSSLNMSGDPTKAIETFEKGLAKYPDDNLLNYNHALTCFQQGLLEKSEASAIRAIKARAGHASSHLILAYTMHQLGNRIKAMIPLYFFLYVEPGTDRSYEAYLVLNELVFKGVERKDEMNINLTISSLGDGAEFATLDMFVSLVAASRFTEEKQSMNDLEFFANFTESFFEMLNLDKSGATSFWNQFYILFFNDLKSSGHSEAFSYFISQSAFPELVIEWVERNPEALEEFFLWTESE